MAAVGQGTIMLMKPSPNSPAGPGSDHPGPQGWGGGAGGAMAVRLTMRMVMGVAMVVVIMIVIVVVMPMIMVVTVQHFGFDQQDGSQNCENSEQYRIHDSGRFGRDEGGERPQGHAERQTRQGGPSQKGCGQKRGAAAVAAIDHKGGQDKPGVAAGLIPWISPRRRLDCRATRNRDASMVKTSFV